MRNKKTGVSVVIPGFNDKDKVFRLLDSVRKSTHKPLEVVVAAKKSKNSFTSGLTAFIIVQ